MPNRELSVVVMSNGRLQPEWIETEETIKQSSRQLQEEIFNRFVADADTGLLFLGFCDKNVALSPSLEYWRRAKHLQKRRSKNPLPKEKEQSSPIRPGSSILSNDQKEGLMSPPCDKRPALMRKKSET